MEDKMDIYGKLIEEMKIFVGKNRQMLFFLLRVLVIYIVWKFVSWFLGEERIPIEERMWPWLSAGWEEFNNGIRIFLLYTSKLVFDLIGYPNQIVSGYRLLVPQLAYVDVGNYCLGIQLWVFFAALICSYPGNWKKKMWYSLSGIFMINVMNVIRIVVIIFAVHAFPKQMQFNHDYVFNVMVYLFTFIIWAKMVRSDKLNL